MEANLAYWAMRTTCGSLCYSGIAWLPDLCLVAAVAAYFLGCFNGAVHRLQVYPAGRRARATAAATRASPISTGPSAAG